MRGYRTRPTRAIREGPSQTPPPPGPRKPRRRQALANPAAARPIAVSLLVLEHLRNHRDGVAGQAGRRQVPRSELADVRRVWRNPLSPDRGDGASRSGSRFAAVSGRAGARAGWRHWLAGAQAGGPWPASDRARVGPGPRARRPRPRAARAPGYSVGGPFLLCPRGQVQRRCLVIAARTATTSHRRRNPWPGCHHHGPPML